MKRPAAAALLLGLSACSGDDSSSPSEPATGGESSGGAPGTGGGSGTGGSTTSAGTPGAGGGNGGSLGGSAGSAGSGGNGGNGGNGGSGGSATSGAGGSSAGSAGDTAGAPTGTPKEEALAPLPAPRQEHAVVAAAGEIYVIGGYVDNSVSTSVIAYDPTDNSWRDVASLPGPVQHPNAGVVDDKIYVAGFYVTAGTTSTSSQVLEYDPMNDGWIERASMPMDTGRAAGCAAVDAGLLYVFGGAIDGTSVDYASRFDPMADEWEILPALPAAREHCAAGAIDGTLYVTGGRVDEIVNIEADTWAFDPVEKTWTPKALLLRPRGGLAAAVLDGRLYTFGGEGNADVSNGIFDDIDVYDPARDSWEALLPMLRPRHGFGAATLGDRIYLAGGAIRQGGGASTEHSAFFFE